MVVITEEIKNFINFQKLGYVATVSIDNTPNLSPKGTITALDESHIAFANIQSPKTVENLNHNSSIEVNVVDPFSRRGYRFKGTAEVISSGDEFDKIIFPHIIIDTSSPIKEVTKNCFNKINEFIK